MPKKYRKGEIIPSLTLLIAELEAGRWVYFKDRPLHPGFILSMTFKTVLGCLSNDGFAIAEEREGHARNTR